MIKKQTKQQVMEQTQRHKDDVGSPEAQVAVLTDQIKTLIDHIDQNHQDQKARRGLIQAVGKRKKLLKYLEKVDYDAYKQTITKLGLRK